MWCDKYYCEKICSRFPLKQMVYIYILTKRRMESRKLKRSTKNTVQKIPEDLRSTEIIKKGIALSSLKS
jgi:hypothetical protein